MDGADNNKNNNNNNNNNNTDVVVWKHIGLHGHAVGSFHCQDDRIVWKSAIYSGTTRDDDHHLASATWKSIPANQLTGTAQWTVFGKSGHVRIQTKAGQTNNNNNNNNLKHEYRLDGFPPNDFELLKDTLFQKYKVNLQPLTMSAAGTQYGLTSIRHKNLVFQHCVLDDMNEEGQEFEPRAEDEMLSLDLAEVTQCVLPGNNRNEIEVQFPESDAVEAGTDQLVAIRFYIPPDVDADQDNDKDAPTAAERLQARIMQTANIRKTSGDIIVSFDQSKGTFLTPRGRYSIDLYDHFLRMRGQKYDYKIKYSDMNRLFLLPKPDEVHMAFVIALDKPIRQGQQRYQYLVLQATKDPDEVTINVDEETLQKEYNGELQPIMRGSLSNLIAKTFKVIAGKKVFIPGKFANANQQPCVKCAVRANEGLLYPLEKQFVFIHKPPILVRFSDVDSVEFQRYAGGQGSTRNFDLCVTLKASAVVGSTTNKDYVFSGIDRSDYAGLYNFLSSKKIPIKNLEGSSYVDEPAVAAAKSAPVYNEDEIYGGPMGDDDDEGSDDEDYDEQAAAADERKAKARDAEDADSDDTGVGGGGGDNNDDDDDDDSEDLDDDELGSEIDEDLDSDLEEARGAAKKKKKRKKSDNDDNDNDNDAADDADADADASPPPKKKKKQQKKVAVQKNDSDDDRNSNNNNKSKKPKKDPKAPKRGMTAYFFFMQEHRDTVKREHPDATFSEVGKLLGAKWKAISAAEKIKYERLANQDKERYKEEMKTYVPTVTTSSSASASDNKKKKKKDPNAPKKPMTSFLLFSSVMRPKIKAEHPDMSFGELGKKVGEMFRGLSAEEKQTYEQQAKHDKVRYKQEMSNYTGADDNDDNDDDDTPKKTKKATKTTKRSIPKKKKVVKQEAPVDDDDDDDDDSDDSDEDGINDDNDDDDDDDDSDED